MQLADHRHHRRDPFDLRQQHRDHRWIPRLLALTRMGFLPRIVEKHNAIRHPASRSWSQSDRRCSSSPHRGSERRDRFVPRRPLRVPGSSRVHPDQRVARRHPPARVTDRPDIRRRLWFAISVMTTALTVIGWSVNPPPSPRPRRRRPRPPGLVIGLWTTTAAAPGVPPSSRCPTVPRSQVDRLAVSQRPGRRPHVILPRDQNVAAAVIGEGVGAAQERRLPLSRTDPAGAPGCGVSDPT